MQDFVQQDQGSINPEKFKKDCINKIIGRYSLSELSGITCAIAGGNSLPINEVVNRLAAGDFNPSQESPEGRQIHMNINSDLYEYFTECLKILRVKNLDEEKLKRYDILHDSWDLRDKTVRKLHKIKLLVSMYGEGDKDLEEAVRDLEWKYQGKS